MMKFTSFVRLLLQDSLQYVGIVVLVWLLTSLIYSNLHDVSHHVVGSDEIDLIVAVAITTTLGSALVAFLLRDQDFLWSVVVAIGTEVAVLTLILPRPLQFGTQIGMAAILVAFVVFRWQLRTSRVSG